jgi:uncharacterized protein with FMN-binding domain
LSGIAGVTSVVGPVIANSSAEGAQSDGTSKPTKTKSPAAASTDLATEPAATKTPKASKSPKATKTEAAPSAVAGNMKDGTFTGGSFSAGSYGKVKVKITVVGGVITKVSTPSLPSNDRESQRINDQAGPWLRGQALGVASASDVAGVSGASYTTSAFKKSLQDAINKAKK